MGELALPLIGMALSTGGSYLNGLQQQQYIEAQAKAEQDAYRVSKQAREAEQGRQKVFSDEAQRYLADTQRQVTPEATAANQDEAVQRFMKVYDERGSSQPEGQYLSGQENATELIKSEIAKRAAT